MHRALMHILLAFWVGLASVPATAGLSEGYVAFTAGDYQIALDELLPLAGRNDSIAAYYVGLMYLEGKGVRPDTRVGIVWLTRAAERGHVAAQFRLAVAYDGSGTRQDYQLAAQWMLAAAEGGHADAQYYLGQYYRDGKGVVQSDQRAYEWIHRSVEYGRTHDRFLDALLYLGAVSEWGRGRRQDLVAAYKWFALAASYSLDDFRIHDEAGRAMDALSLRMSPSQLAQAQRLAEAWRRDGSIDAADGDTASAALMPGG